MPIGSFTLKNYTFYDIAETVVDLTFLNPMKFNPQRPEEQVVVWFDFGLHPLYIEHYR